MFRGATPHVDVNSLSAPVMDQYMEFAYVEEAGNMTNP